MRGKKSTMTDERYRKLKDAGFVFTILDREEKRSRDSDGMYYDNHSGDSSAGVGEEEEEDDGMVHPHAYAAMHHHGRGSSSAQQQQHHPHHPIHPHAHPHAYNPWDRYDTHHY
jgi:hypothetical protein